MTIPSTSSFPPPPFLQRDCLNRRPAHDGHWRVLKINIHIIVVITITGVVVIITEGLAVTIITTITTTNLTGAQLLPLMIQTQLTETHQGAKASKILTVFQYLTNHLSAVEDLVPPPMTRVSELIYIYIYKSPPTDIYIMLLC